MSTHPISETTRFDLTDWNAVALGLVRELRPVPVYDTSRLKVGTVPILGDDPSKTRNAWRVSTRRTEVRRLNQELSTYYELPEGVTEWTRLDILRNGKHYRGNSSVTFPPYPHSFSVP